MVANVLPSGGTGARRWRWLAVLAGGTALWIASVLVVISTGNPALVPTVVLLGSFLVPASAVVWNFDHQADSALSAQRVVYAFIGGGTLGVLLASLLESWLLQDAVLPYLAVGLIEEAVKLIALALFSIGLPRYTTRDGVVLGAAIGFGFAALESSGYAFVALLGPSGGTLSSVVGTQILRNVLAPVGHGLWTAILGGLLFHAAARRGRPWPSWGLAGGYLLVSLLHAAWDGMRGVALLLTMLLVATPAQLLLLERGVLPPLQGWQEGLFLGLEFAGLLLLALISVGVLLAVRRRGEPARR
jgi:RsiW-degrading membrane proteinase PrsW (M82 family)